MSITLIDIFGTLYSKNHYNSPHATIAPVKAHHETIIRYKNWRKRY